MNLMINEREYPYYCEVVRAIYFEPGFYISIYQLEYLRLLSNNEKKFPYTCATSRALENRGCLERGNRITEKGFWKVAEYEMLRAKLMFDHCYKRYVSRMKFK